MYTWYISRTASSITTWNADGLDGVDGVDGLGGVDGLDGLEAVGRSVEYS